MKISDRLTFLRTRALAALLAIVLGACVSPGGEIEFPALDEASDRVELRRIAIEKTREHMIKLGENPQDYYLVGIRRVEDLLILDLSYETDFQKRYKNTLGNHSGKSRSCEFQVAIKRVTECLLWK
ncbi:MAG: hypothetical protein HKN85_07520 [Gammaproteobacteria bacterium]|nr:hypothetical protein [Gammaproteobacteria bacterium]